MRALLLLMVTSSVYAAPWKVDPELGFALVYLDAPATTKKPASTPLLHRAIDKPDIDNIKYGGLLELGFPLPPIDQPDEHRFLIKLYEYPKQLNASLSVHRALDPFHLELVEGGRELVTWAETHATIKLAYVDDGKSKRMPLFELPTQERLDSHVPFTTIYLQPSSAMGILDGPPSREEKDALASTIGVMFFRGDLITAYRKAFTELAPMKDRLVFTEPRHCADGKDLCGVHVIEVAMKPFEFSNWRQLPMPQDPNHVFLSALVLVTTTELSVAPGTSLDAKTTLDSLKKSGKVLTSQLLEVGSMYRKP